MLYLYVLGGVICVFFLIIGLGYYAFCTKMTALNNITKHIVNMVLDMQTENISKNLKFVHELQKINSSKSGIIKKGSKILF